MQPGVDFIGVGVGAVITKNGKIFVAQRGPEARNEQGKWEFPGGMVEFGATLEETLKREIKEEYDFEIEIVELLHVVDHFLESKKEHWVSPTYLARYISGEPKIKEPTKCSQTGWFSLDEIEDMQLSEVTLHDIRAIRERFPMQFPIW